MHESPIKPPTALAPVAATPATAAARPFAPAFDPAPAGAVATAEGPSTPDAGRAADADQTGTEPAGGLATAAVDENAAGEGAAETAEGLARGVLAVRQALKAAPAGSGVYRMIADDGGVLYVGKAKALGKRLVAYARPAQQSIRIRRMIARTRHVELVTTATEAEALLLEANLIKRYKPRYNILLRDDKSFPSILIPSDHAYPQVLKHRGARARPGAYFGPFASGYAVNETLTILQRAFLLRTCSDSVFESRTRPCLLFQIKRCSGPCAERIAQDAYTALVEQARAYLKGESRAIQEGIVAEMELASAALDFERAAVLRDRIRALAAVQARQSVNVEGVGDADVVASHAAGGQTCVQVFFIRGGRNYGNRAYFPSHAADELPGAVVEAFLGQFYQGAMPPAEVLVSERLPGHAVLAEALGVRAGRKIEVRVPQRGPRRQLIEHAQNNAREALQRHMAENASQRRLLDGLAQALGLDAPPERIEVYDNSHIRGADAFGAMIVAGPEGLMKNAYRKFRIRAADGIKPSKARAAKAALKAAPVPNAPGAPAGPGEAAAEAAAWDSAVADALRAVCTADDLDAETASDAGALAPAGSAVLEKAGGGAVAGGGFVPGDDYAMMREVLTRRFARALAEDPDRARGQWPDLVLIDGGPGHLAVARQVFDALGIGDVALAAVAKGPDRNAGRERIHRAGQPPLALPPSDPVLYFIQRLRDEAHRFAIGTHRAKRSRGLVRSVLDDIPGIGSRRKRALLHHFGSAQAVGQAGPADLAGVAGISRQTARKIYDWFHPGD